METRLGRSLSFLRFRGEGDAPDPDGPCPCRPGGKRGAGLQHLPLSDEIPWINLNSEDVMDLNRALDELDSVDPRKVRLVELRYFLGCTLTESAALLSISTATAERDLTLVRTWLYSRLVVKKESALPPESSCGSFPPVSAILIESR